MYNCQECGQTQQPRTVAHKKIMETRTKTYPGGTKGFEIVKEITVCPECHEEDMNERSINEKS